MSDVRRQETRSKDRVFMQKEVLHEEGN